MRRIVGTIAATALVALGAAPAAGAHVLTRGVAEAIAERRARLAADRTPWAEEWDYECSRETSWTFSCNAQVWSNGPTGYWCWEWFDVVQPHLGIYGKPRIENPQPRECELSPT